MLQQPIALKINSQQIYFLYIYDFQACLKNNIYIFPSYLSFTTNCEDLCSTILINKL